MLKCRICKNENTAKILDLGKTALANSFLKEKDFSSEKFYPLNVYFCKDCCLVQLGEIVSPDVMFKNYLYVSGTSETMKSHFQEFAIDVLNKISKSKSPLVIDVGSNDGTLLKGFLNSNVRVLGVEPSNIAKVAKDNGIDTFNDFFNKETASKILKEKGMAKAILGANVFAHSPELDSFMEGVNVLLDNDGIFVIEFPYLVNLLQGIEFDTIYHEHVFYFSITPLMRLFERFGFEIFEIKKTKVHGGSLRVFVRRIDKTLPTHIEEFIELERKMRLDSVETYLDFAKKVEKFRQQLNALLLELKSSGKRIAGYGAAAKANTLLSYCGVGTDMLDYIADKNPLKQGMYTPGTHIPVVPIERIQESKVDYLLILAWNFADEIMKQQKVFQENGGRFIIPLPVPTII